MYTAAEYVAAAWESVGPHAAAQNVALTAEKAVQMALDDSERYKNLLLKALRGTSTTTTEPHEQH